MSGIYIPGMEMPKEHEHPIHLAIFPCGTIEYDRVSDGLGWRICKAIPVPDHGRLIDAFAFEAHVQNEWENNEISNREWIQFREWLRDELTIIPADPEEDE